MLLFGFRSPLYILLCLFLSWSCALKPHFHLHHFLCFAEEHKQCELKHKWQFASSFIASPWSSSHGFSLPYMPSPFHHTLAFPLQLSGGFIIKDLWHSLGSSFKSFCQTDLVSQISLPLTGGDMKIYVDQAHTLSHRPSAQPIFVQIPVLI